MKIIRISAAVLLISFVSFIIIEVLLRILDPFGVEYFSEVERYFSKLDKKEYYSYIHPSGLNDDFQNVNITVNSFNLRGPEFKAEKPAGRKRLLILGDSVVLGWGVEYNDTFPALLNSAFSIDSGSIEFIPAGVSSWNTRTEYEFFKRVASGFNPDAVIMIIVSNDTDPKENSNIEVGKEELLKLVYKPKTGQGIFKKIWFGIAGSSYFLKHIQVLYKISTEYNQHSGSSENDITWKDAERALNGLIKLCNEKEIEFYPFVFSDYLSAREHPIYSLYMNYFEKNNIKCGTFPKELFNSRNRNSLIDNHPNREGHKIISNEIMNTLNINKTIRSSN